MALKVIISGSRHAQERQIIKEKLNEYALFDIEIYDCNDTPSPLSVDGKQTDINEIIQKFDWYILVASTTKYGKYTYKEWEVVTDSILTKPYDQVISVIKCNNRKVSENEQSVPYDTSKKYYAFEDFEALCKKKGIQTNFYVDYTYDKKFSDLKNEVEQEIKKMLRNNLVLRQDSISLKQMQPVDVFMNRYRATTDGGFEEEHYLSREQIDDILDIQKGCSFIIGPSAAGKTRAMYEFLKRRRNQAVNVINERLIVVTSHNLEAVTQHVMGLAKLKESLSNKKGLDLSTYYFVFDQVGDLLYKDAFVSLFDDLIRYLTSYFKARVLITGFKENYDELITKVGNRDEINPIFIQSLQTDLVNVKRIKEFLRLKDDDKITHAVIGEYVKGLVEYIKYKQIEIEEYFKQQQNRELIETFVKSYSVIMLYRKLNLPPLALVLAVMNKILGSGEELTTRQLRNGLLTFFFDKNILVLEEEGKKVSHRQIGLIESELDLTYDSYEFDGEDLNLPMSPDFLIRIENDYLWHEFFLKRYAYKVDCIQDMKNAMMYYAKAFLKDVPLKTLRRIISRSPSVPLAVRFGAHSDFVGPFVEEQFRKLYRNNKLAQYSRIDLCEFLSYFIHRSVDFEDFKTRFEFAESKLKEGKYAQTQQEKEFSADQIHFLLDEINVAELMGFGFKRGSMIQSKVMKFIESLGWNFTSHQGHYVYYHMRVIQHLADFDEVQHYVEMRILPTAPEHFVIQQADKETTEKGNFIMACVGKCTTCEDMLQVLDWIETLHLGISRNLLFYLIGLKKKNVSWYLNPIANQRIVKRIADMLLQITSDDIVKQMHPRSVSQGATYLIREEPILTKMKYYYLLELSSTFLNAKPYFEAGLPYWNDNIELRNRAISQLIEVMQNYEFSHMYNVFFKEGKRAVDIPLPQISRNLLLKHLNLDDALNLLEQLFDGSDADSTPDVNTLISLLLANKEFIKKHANQNDKVQAKNRFAFQNLKMILMHPCLKNIIYNESAIDLMFFACHSIRQETQILNQFVKPNRRRLLLKKYGSVAVSNSGESKVQEYIRYIQSRPEYAINHLNTFTQVPELIAYAKKFIIQMVAQQKTITTTMILNPSFVSNLFNRLVYLYVRAYGGAHALAKEEFRSQTTDLYHFLFNPLNGGDSCLMDYFYKDNYLYAALYRLYPERAVQREENGDYHWTPEFMNLSAGFIDEKLFGNVLMGLAAFMGEEAVHAVEEWIIQHVEDYKRDQRVNMFILKFLPNYHCMPICYPKQRKNNHSHEYSDGWGFLSKFFYAWSTTYRKGKDKDAAKACELAFDQQIMPQIIRMKESNEESTPNISLVHNLFKNGMMTSEQTFHLLKEVYLDAGLVITATLWKSALENLKRIASHADKHTGQVLAQEFKAFKAEYHSLILEDSTTLCYQLSLLTGEDREACFREIRNKNSYHTQIELSELIQHIDLFLPNLDDYIKVMRNYVLNNYLIYDAVVVTPTYNHFIVNLLRYYFPMHHQITYSHQLFLFDLLRSMKKHMAVRDVNWLKRNLSNAYDYEGMIEDIKLSTGRTI